MTLQLRTKSHMKFTTRAKSFDFTTKDAITHEVHNKGKITFTK